MKPRTRTALLGVLLGVFVLGVSFAARAEVLGAELQVLGMSCPFCAFGIEKKLRAVEGVRDVTVFLDDGRIELAFSPKNAAQAADIDAAVKKAGFELSGLRVEVRGTLASDDATPVLEAAEEVQFRLLDAKTQRPISRDELEKLRGRASGGTLVVEGRVDGWSSNLPGLLLDGTEAAAGGPR